MVWFNPALATGGTGLADCAGGVTVEGVDAEGEGAGVEGAGAGVVSAGAEITGVEGAGEDTGAEAIGIVVVEEGGGAIGIGVEAGGASGNWGPPFTVPAGGALLPGSPELSMG